MGRGGPPPPEGWDDNPGGAVTTDQYPGGVIPGRMYQHVYPASPPPTGPRSNPMSSIMAGIWYVPFATSGQTYDTIQVQSGIPGGYMFKNHSAAPLYIGLGGRPLSDLFNGLYDDEVDPSSFILAPWPEQDAIRKQLTWWQPGSATCPQGFVRWYILPYDPGLDAGSLDEGPATGNQAYTGTITGGGADVTLTIAPTAKGIIIANDSAAGQTGIDYYFTNRVSSAGVPIFPFNVASPPSQGDNAPFNVAQGKEYPVDIEVSGILVHNTDGSNAANYRVWIVD